MTILPATRCRPPANRSSAAISALRQQGLVTDRRESSSLTAAVIAMFGPPIPAVSSALGRPPQGGQGRAVGFRRRGKRGPAPAGPPPTPQPLSDHACPAPSPR